jgi:hypothetical protein
MVDSVVDSDKLRKNVRQVLMENHRFREVDFERLQEELSKGSKGSKGSEGRKGRKGRGNRKKEEEDGEDEGIR